jgi:copper(I)-binding protein
MRPKARHLRLVGLTRHLNAYDSVPLTLYFKKAGKIEIEVLVEPPE